MRAYLAAGLCVLPARWPAKRPAIGSWKDYQARLPTDAEVAAWFANPHPACCLICGAVSGNLELIDFDCAGEAFSAWSQLVAAEAPGLLDRLVVETSPSGGWHVVYRAVEAVNGNLKLAQRREDVDGPSEVERFGKGYKPRKDRDGHWHIVLTLIETRGEGGLFLCAPSAGYQLAQGAFTALPVLTPEEREVLLRCAWALNTVLPETQDPQPASRDGLRPGDDFNRRADIAALLTHHGWTLVREGANQHWCRPGKSGSTSATLKDGVFYVFSSNAAPFEPNRAYSPFAVYAHLEHAGDFAAAATELRRLDFGEPRPPAQPAAEPELAAPEHPDPGPLPADLLRVPGFITEVADYTLATAPYPEPTLAVAGAIALQATLAGRKVRDTADMRPNLYLLGLANSGAGKDHPRKVNLRILLEAGLAAGTGDNFASAEGLEDRMVLSPTTSASCAAAHSSSPSGFALAWPAARRAVGREMPGADPLPAARRHGRPLSGRERLRALSHRRAPAEALRPGDRQRRTGRHAHPTCPWIDAWPGPHHLRHVRHPRPPRLLLQGRPGGNDRRIGLGQRHATVDLRPDARRSGLVPDSSQRPEQWDRMGLHATLSSVGTIPG